ncbi:CBS domain-containing protein [Rhodovulum adriaticum]|uniref:CBS domain protein n=1 Tax=Rhodovulum adriaticum TaxID=35804 RepID=A0A4R2NWG0_RHOAD|nr:CBS domain-containing protein [Rhodovulum adriaticum]TCP26509.1 CBS domain protein [Rhodovulum adriaticum]
MIIKTIGEILGQRPFISLAPGETLRTAATHMEEANVGALAVVEAGRLVGILSERDIVRRAVAQGMAPDSVTVAQAMTPDPVTIAVDDPVSDALAAKLGDAFRHLPVLRDGLVVGVVSYRDIPAEYLMLFERFREMSGAHADDTP